MQWDWVLSSACAFGSLAVTTMCEEFYLLYLVTSCKINKYKHLGLYCHLSSVILTECGLTGNHYRDISCNLVLEHREYHRLFHSLCIPPDSLLPVSTGLWQCANASTFSPILMLLMDSWFIWREWILDDDSLSDGLANGCCHRILTALFRPRRAPYTISQRSPSPA